MIVSGWNRPPGDLRRSRTASRPFSVPTRGSTSSPATSNRAELSGSGHPDRDPLHRDKELLVNPLSLYWLHMWWGADRMYFRMCSVLQGHDELEGLVLIYNRDV
jgi:hypothetical protein